MRAFFVRSQAPLPRPADILTFVWGDFEAGNEVADEEATTGARVLQAGDGQKLFLTDVGEADVVLVRSEDGSSAARAAYFMAVESAGAVATREGGPFGAPEELVAECGAEFRLEHALARVRRRRMRLPEYFERRFAFLETRVSGELADLVDRGPGRILMGRTTHAEVSVNRWIGRDVEAVASFATDRGVPDPYFTCLVAGYMIQEWIFVLWTRKGRRFWFASPILGTYQDVDAGPMSAELQYAIDAFDEGTESVFYLSGKGLVKARP